MHLGGMQDAGEANAACEGVTRRNLSLKNELHPAEILDLAFNCSRDRKDLIF